MNTLRQGLVQRVDAAFAVDGPLAQGMAAYRQRPGQLAMAGAVAEVLAQGGVLVAEAGTGTGKTFAYLVPALLSGERMVLSTATKALQEQLFDRDVPALLRALGLSAKTAMLKGRASYVCVHRLGFARHTGSRESLGFHKGLAAVERWLTATHTGDLSEVPAIADQPALLAAVSSTRENCLNARCPRLADCHVNQARRAALAADVLVVNHHLFFADVCGREPGMTSLLPSLSAVVFDEAHRLNEVGVSFAGHRLDLSQCLALCRDVLATGTGLAQGFAPWHPLSAEVVLAARRWFRYRGLVSDAGRLAWDGASPWGSEDLSWAADGQALQRQLQAMAQALALVSEVAPDFVRLHEQTMALTQAVHRFLHPKAEATVRWVEVRGSQAPVISLVEAPVTVAGFFQALRYQLGSLSEREPSWVFTSATLGHDDRLSWFTQTCGLDDAQVLRVPSPFDHAAQSALYVPGVLPEPSDPKHSEALAALTIELVEALKGRTLILTTTLRAMQVIAQALSTHFDQPDDVLVLTQDAQPRAQLLALFRQGGMDPKRGCVLVASMSFWEGLDIPGDALQMLVLDKLPFAPPDDPWVSAQSQVLVRQGRNPFDALLLPGAAMALRQGAGRLIRSESDRGLLVIGDTRLVTRAYGRQLVSALPRMPVVADQAEALRLIEGLITKVSTTVKPQI